MIKRRKKTKKLKKIIISFIAICAFFGFVWLGINIYVKSVAEKTIFTVEEADSVKNADCILVLGCGVKPDGTPSDMLKDRLNRAVELYEQGAAPKLLMSGDHGRDEYDEVNAMKNYAISKGVPSEDIFMDHAGFSTYDSVCRAKDIFGVSKIIIITQKYHLYRAVFIAQKIGMDAYGVDSDFHHYTKQIVWSLRESVARCKDFFAVIFDISPKYTGEQIDISGSGDVTNDK